MNPGITIIGLGPGGTELLTRQAWETLNSITEIYVRTAEHPAVPGFPANLRVHSFDHFYEESESFEEVYSRIVEWIINLGISPTGVVYGVPGHPLVAEATTPEIIRQARLKGIPINLVEGISFIEPTFSLLELDPFPQTALVDALVLKKLHYPPFPPSAPALIAQVYSQVVASEVKLTLMAVYPDEHRVQLVHGAGTDHAFVEQLALYEIDRARHTGLQTSLFVPPLEVTASFESFQEIVAHLRAPEGCPWDREQTHKSLRPFLIEEAFELVAALDAEDQKSMREELGDLLLQIVLHAQIGSELGEFTMADVLMGIHEKLVRRHPHVFGDLILTNADRVVENWEKLKIAERAKEGEGADSLAGVSVALPALFQAQTYQDRAARAGLDWGMKEDLREKITAGLKSLESVNSPEEIEIQLGDLLFTIVSLARRLDVDAESALRGANTRFRERFTSNRSGEG
jgi:tetrapyrrole methylase family protein/MazG family protein